MPKKTCFAVSTKIPKKFRQRNDAPEKEDNTTNTSENNSSPTRTMDSTSSSSTSEEYSTALQSFPISLWPGGRILYYFEPEFTSEQRSHVITAMGHIELATGGRIEFIDIGQEPSDAGGYMFIGFGDSYEATLGYVVDEPTTLTLTEAALNDKMGIVMHEILHALGIMHEHNRPDRDNYVTICWDNIEHHEKHNFLKAIPEDYEVFDVPYNYYSVMHYSSHSFSKDERKPTIIFKDKGVAKEFVGQRCFITMEDLALLKKKYMYEAPAYNGWY
ncbi:tolloid-like protein 1 [Rhodnius prolixus]|uniref:Metalloendopeptidase n=1 Tax=Rhodnius prolixus TaxID=13249 RepID=T1HGS4_RHOPR